MGRLARIASGLVGTLVAVGVGLVVGAVGWAHLAEPKLGVVAGVVAGIAASAILRLLWAHRLGRIVAILAVLGHIGYWSARGMQEIAYTAPSATDVAHELSWPQATAFRVGVGRVPVDLPEDAPLAGWGSGPRRKAVPAFGGLGPLGRASLAYMAAPDGTRTHRRALLADAHGSTGAAGDQVGASAVVLRPAEGAPVALVTLDTVTVDHALASAIAEDVAALGFPRAGVLVSATHTHSGPGGYSREPLSQVVGTDHFHPDVFAALRVAAVAAVRAAFESATPAHVALVRARDRGPDGPVLALNRRLADDEIDDRVFGLRFDEPDGSPRALVLNYAVHPVVFRRRYLAPSRDVVGAIERELGDAWGAPVLFLNGALGDVSPRPTPGIAGAARCTELARRFAAVVLDDVRAAQAHPRLHVAAQRRALDLGTPMGVRAWGDRGPIAAAAQQGFGGGTFGGWVADILTLPVNAFVWSLGLPEARVIARFGDGVGLCANLSTCVPTTTFGVGAWVFTAGDEHLGLLWHPGEATAAVGRAMRRAAAAEGVADAMIVGLAEGACAYLTDEAEYARASYEARATVFGAAATQAIHTEALKALRAAHADAPE